MLTFREILMLRGTCGILMLPSYALTLTVGRVTPHALTLTCRGILMLLSYAHTLTGILMLQSLTLTAQILMLQSYALTLMLLSYALTLTGILMLQSYACTLTGP